MKGRLRRLRLLLLEVWTIVYHGGRSSLRWAYQAWSSAWSLVFGLVGIVINVVLSRQIGAIIAVVAVLLFGRLGPSTLNEVVPQMSDWEVAAVSGEDLEIFIHHPLYVAGEDNGYFEISVQNGTSETMHDVLISIRSTEGKIVFDDGNVVAGAILQPGEAVSKKLPFHIARNIGDACITTTVVSAFTSEDGRTKRFIQGKNTPTLCASVWRVPVVMFQKLPGVLQTGAEYVGYVSGMVAGILLLFREQLRPIGENVATKLLRGE